MIDYLKTLFSYDDWANRESLRSLQRVDSPPQRALQVMSHIIGCQWLWIGRLKRSNETAEVWPQLSLSQCFEELTKLLPIWEEYLGDLTESDLDQRFDYINSKGEDWESRVEDTLIHVTLHSSYHRGQIATLLGRAGFEPAYTDFIHCIRTKKVN